MTDRRYKEQVEADLMRTLYRLRILPSIDELGRLIDELQLQLWEREGISRRSAGAITDTATPTTRTVQP